MTTPSKQFSAHRRLATRIAGLGVFAAAAALSAEAKACDPVLKLAFIEDAPTDFLRLTNASAGDWRLVAAEIDLVPSAGALLLDTVRGGPGTGVAAAFRHADGPAPIAQTGITDGSTGFSFQFDGVAAGGGAAFALDLDDTLPPGSSRTRVAGSEIQEAKATARFRGPSGAEITVTGAFDDRGGATLEPSVCS